MSRRVGYRFQPSDEEIITYFLKHKMDGYDSLVDDDIRQIEICKYEPWELPGYAAMESNDQVWYFFNRQDYKYANSRLVNRATKAGYWKSQGRDRTIRTERTKKEIGTKKTLVFYKGRVPDGVKTNWIIHEYRPKTVLPQQRAFVLCKLKKDKKNDSSACDDGEPSHHIPPNFESHPIEIPIPQEDAELLNGFNFSHPSVQQSQIHIEGVLVGPSFVDTWFTNGFSSGTNGFGFQFDASEQEDDPIKLADSFLVDYDTPYDSSPLNSLRRVHPEHISDTDIEIFPRESSQLPGTSNVQDGHASSKEYRQMRTVQAFTETLPPSVYEHRRKEKNGSHHDEIVLMMSASVGSDTDEDIKFSEVREAPHGRSQFRGKLSKTVSEHKARKATKNHSEIDLPKKENSILPKKENFVVESKEEWKMAPPERSSNLKINGLAGNNRIGSFIHLETPPLSHKQSPPLVYVVNVIVGLVLFIVFIRKVLFCTEDLYYSEQFCCLAFHDD